jgi:hypothetical protein
MHLCVSLSQSLASPLQSLAVPHSTQWSSTQMGFSFGHSSHWIGSIFLPAVPLLPSLPPVPPLASSPGCIALPYGLARDPSRYQQGDGWHSERNANKSEREGVEVDRRRQDASANLLTQARVALVVTVEWALVRMLTRIGAGSAAEANAIVDPFLSALS